MSERGPFYSPGTYLCYVLDHGFEISKNGNPMIVFRLQPKFEIFSKAGADGEIYEEQQPTEKQWIRTARLVIVADNQESINYALAKLRYAGFEGERFEDLHLEGESVRFLCEHQNYLGKTYESWNLPLPPRQDTEPLKKDVSVVKRLNSLFGRRLSEPSSTPKAPTPAMATAASGQPLDDDIPF